MLGNATRAHVRLDVGQCNTCTDLCGSVRSTVDRDLLVPTRTAYLRCSRTRPRRLVTTSVAAAKNHAPCWGTRCIQVHADYTCLKLNTHSCHSPRLTKRNCTTTTITSTRAHLTTEVLVVTSTLFPQYTPPPLHNQRQHHYRRTTVHQ